MAAFGRPGRLLVDGCLIFTQLGFCCVYLIFLGNNLHAIYPSLAPKGYIVLCMAVLAFIAWIRSLKWFSPFSALAGGSTIFGILAVNLYAMFWYDAESEMERLPLFVPETFFIFFGIATATYEGIGLVIPIQQSMKEPEKYTTLLNVAFVFVTTFFLWSGLTSFYCFREATDSIITLNLPNNMFGITVQTVLVCAIFFTYPIQLFPAVEIAEAAIFGPAIASSDEDLFSDLGLKRNAVRSLLVIITGAVALLVPHFGEVIGLIGSIGASMLAFTMPALFYLRLFYPTISRKEASIYVSIMAVGILGGLAAAFDVIAHGEE